MNKLEILCFSHVRWDAEIQRPQYLMRRAAKGRRVFYVEEPIYKPGFPKLLLDEIAQGALWKVTPRMPPHLSPNEQDKLQRLLIHQLLDVHAIRNYAVLTYTPTAVRFVRELEPRLWIYDCLSRFGPQDDRLFACETELLRCADLLINDAQQIIHQPALRGGQQVFPGSLEVDHFFQARSVLREPADQAIIPHPRLGFWGVINRLFDQRLIEAVAERRPDWHFLLLGPITVDTGSLLNRKNIHYLCTRTFAELPGYLSGWDAAVLPLAWWEPGAHIAATQIPQYLAGGCPVVATNAPPVVRCFENRRLVETAETPDQFVQAVERALTRKLNSAEWLEHVDNQLAEGAWDLAWEWVSQSIELALQRRGQTTKERVDGGAPGATRRFVAQ